MKCRLRSLIVTSAGLGTLVIALPAAAGPVTVVSQNRSVHVAIPSIVEGEAAIDETLTAPDENPFVTSLDRSLNQAGQTNSASASQDSNFGNVSDSNFNVAASGDARYSATGLDGIVFADSNFELQFQLDESRDYTINGSGSFPDTGSGASDFSVTLTGPGGTVATFTKADFDPGNVDGAQINPTFNTSGTLAAGLYTLAADAAVSGGTNTNEIASSFAFTFAASADAVNPPQPPVPIPLPAGFGPGAAMLAGIAVLTARKHLRRGCA
jgi:hypothetical protein